ncbi:MAG: ABC transporter substrate-binding protein [Alphaproteobacteria bacterium]|nr:ABC transporter substrate-binding protein [Alphaproteobacteria bacterium]
MRVFSLHFLRFVKPLLALAALLGAPNAVAAELLRLGFVSSQSGNAAHRSEDFTEGFRLGLKNLGGRLGGAEVDLSQSDDQSDPEKSAAAARKLIERERVHLISGPTSPETSLAVAEAVKGDGPIFISPAYGPLQFAGANCRMGFFSLVPSEEVFAEASAHAFGGENIRPVAALVPQQSDTLRKFADLTKSFLPELALYEAEAGQLVFDVFLSKLKSEKVQGIAVYLGGGTAVGFLRQLHRWEMKDGKMLFATWPLLEPFHFSALGEAGVGVRAFSPWAEDPDNLVSKKFMVDFEDEFRRPPSSFAALGYDLALLLDQAIRQQGGRVGDRTQLARSIAAVQLASTRGPLRFSNNHFAVTPLFLREGGRDAKGRLTAGRKASITAPQDRHAHACPIAAPEPPPAEPTKKR